MSASAASDSPPPVAAPALQPSEEVPQSHRPKDDGPPPPGTLRTKPCRHHAAGRCSWGNSCRFLHTHSAAQPAVSKKLHGTAARAPSAQHDSDQQRQSGTVPKMRTADTGQPAVHVVMSTQRPRDVGNLTRANRHHATPNPGNCNEAPRLQLHSSRAAPEPADCTPAHPVPDPRPQRHSDAGIVGLPSSTSAPLVDLLDGHEESLSPSAHGQGPTVGGLQPEATRLQRDGNMTPQLSLTSHPNASGRHHHHASTSATYNPVSADSGHGAVRFRRPQALQPYATLSGAAIASPAAVPPGSHGMATRPSGLGVRNSASLTSLPAAAEPMSLRGTPHLGSRLGVPSPLSTPGTAGHAQAPPSSTGTPQLHNSGTARFSHNPYSQQPRSASRSSPMSPGAGGAPGLGACGAFAVDFAAMQLPQPLKPWDGR